MKSEMVKYLALRLVFLMLGTLLIYHFSFYLLPKNIQDDEFSFVAELNLISNLTLIFYLAYSGFIFWEYLKFRKKTNLKLIRASVVVLVITLLMVCVAFQLSFKL